ncbi:hypothetical protein T4E_9319 [Trichinella pseudospiralis]|uniref:Uncharacterized protein n=1 Tax=Trichinella pseudospiralis TaxID=6337 RepID=A0A0V0XEG1_TRIPS|nr:hypothetical protein T4E_9319 [Trichinella pseudospiralis]
MEQYFWCNKNSAVTIQRLISTELKLCSAEIIIQKRGEETSSNQ